MSPAPDSPEPLRSAPAPLRSSGALRPHSGATPERSGALRSAPEHINIIAPTLQTPLIHVFFPACCVSPHLGRVFKYIINK